jgi:hypothetical protein
MIPFMIGKLSDTWSPVAKVMRERNWLQEELYRCG